MGKNMIFSNIYPEIQKTVNIGIQNKKYKNIYSSNVDADSGSFSNVSIIAGSISNLTTVSSSNQYISGTSASFDNLLVNGSYQQSGSDIITSTGEQTGKFKTRSYLIFGRSGTIYTDTYMGGPGSLNDSTYKGEYVVLYDSVLTGVALSVQTSFIFDSSGDQINVVVQKATGVGSTSWSTFNDSLTASQVDGDHGNYYKMVTGQTSTLSAGDRIRIWLNVTEVQTVNIIDPNVTVCLLSE